jgi:DNA-binding response OmpR family regulator
MFRRHRVSAGVTLTGPRIPVSNVEVMSEPPDTGTILVVDDLQDYLDLYERRLGDEYEVVTANGGQAALERVGPDVDVVLLDRDMPEVPGREVLADIRAADYECRVAMVTAEEPDEDVVELGYDAYLQKPVSGPELTETVDRLLRLTAYGDAIEAFHSVCERRRETLASDAEVPASLQTELQSRRERVDALASEFENEDFRVVFRDLGTQQFSA